MVDDSYEEKPFGHMGGGEAVKFFFVVLFFLGCIAFYLFGIAGDSGQATRLLEQKGYTDIQITGGSVLGCGEGDWKKTTFRARNMAGNMERGIVCCGVVKGCTVRSR